MPEYPMTCTRCSKPTTLFCTFAQRAAHRCDCGGELTLNMGEVTIRTERVFYGTRESTSVSHMFHPSEVRDVKRSGLFTAGRIHDNGMVSFDSRSDERKFQSQMAKARAKYDPSYGTVEKLNAASKAKRDGTRQSPWKLRKATAR